MANDSAASPDQQKEAAAKFLDSDFNQCFQQMQYYDGQIIDICKFAFTVYAAIVGAALTLYKYGADKGIDFRAPAVSLLAIGLLLGLCLLALMARDRVYFVVVTRYVNEIRQHFLTQKPLGLESRSLIYRDPTEPRFFNWQSSQALLLYILALMNSGLLAMALYLLCSSVPCRWTILISASFLFLVAELVSSIAYLISREGKSAARAVS